jgi:abortive infection bacteriophage resistance protein
MTFEDQADQLIRRGLIADRSSFIETLRTINYYRLSGYLYPFRNPDDSFKPGTTLEAVLRRYGFDRHLRLLVMDGIERVEVGVRTQVVYHFAHKYGAFGYADHHNLVKLSKEEHGEFLRRLNEERSRSKEAFIVHFENNYGDCHPHLPLWMVCEIMSFGSLFTFFRGMEMQLKQMIASVHNISDEVMESWLRALNSVRNICAHHARLWNRELGYKPLIPKSRKHPEWHEPVEVPNNRIFGILTILQYMLCIIHPAGQWKEKLESLILEYPDIPLKLVGFMDQWRDCPIWIVKNDI